jgi:AcrR family transcriptional regulator
LPKSRWISDLHWVRTGRQPRSQKTQEALLDAAAILFSEKGAEATSMADVAARAGRSVGSVYHHLRDRPSLKRAAREASRSDPALRERLAELHSELDQGLSVLLLTRRREIRHPDPERATGFVLDQLGSMLRTRLDETLMPTLLAGRSDEEFVREALRSACAYLGTAMPSELEASRARPRRG